MRGKPLFFCHKTDLIRFLADLSQNAGFIRRFDALDRRFAPRAGIEVHGDGGLADEGC